jgi:hypothetical protein
VPIPHYNQPQKRQTPAGWFPDPAGSSRKRYWDGQQWTGLFHPQTLPAPQPAPQMPVPPPPAPVAAAPAHATGWWGIPRWVWTVAGLVGLYFIVDPQIDFPWERKVDTLSVEMDIEHGLRKQAKMNVTAECPTEVEWETGGSFHCIVSTLNGRSVGTAVVHMENDEGDVTWRIE